MAERPDDPESRELYDAFAKAFLAALKKRVSEDVIIAAVAERPLAAYWHFNAAHQAARRAGIKSPAPWMEVITSEIEGQGVTIPPGSWVRHYA